jgi:hypothetical protein
MFRRKIKSIIAVCLVLITLQGCSFMRNKPLTTPQGVELSKPLTTVIDFLAGFQTAYITLGNLTVESYKSGAITKEQYNRITVYAENIRVVYVQQKALVLEWYNAESRGIFVDKSIFANELISALTQNFKNLVDVIKIEVDLSPKDIQAINALLLILETFSEVK